MKILPTLLIIYFFCGNLLATKPNIILVHIDDELLASVDFRTETPTIQDLKSKALLLPNFYTPTAVECSVELLSGKYPATIKNVALDGDILGSEPCIAKTLKEQGYVSAYIGKWRDSDSPSAYPNALGFDLFYGVLASDIKWPYDWQMKAALAGKLNANDIKSPSLSLVMNSNIIEIPANPDRFIEDFTRETLDFIDASQTEKKPFFIYLNYASVYEKAVALEKYFPSEEKLEVRKYYKSLDSAFGKVLKELRRGGALEDSLIVFVSKSAMQALPEYKNNPKNLAPESKHKLSAFVYMPKLFKDAKSLNMPVSSLDIYGLIGDVASGDKSDKSLLGYLLGESDWSNNPILFYSPYREVFSMLDGDLKLLLDKELRKVPLQLYDLLKDPLELNNLADTEVDKANSLRKKAQLLAQKQPKVLTKDELQKKEKAEKKAKESTKKKQKDEKSKTAKQS